MEAKTMLNSIKQVLGMEVKLEQQTLENGTIIEADSFEVGQEVFIITDDEKVAVPAGEYQLEDGRILVVNDGGEIAEIGAKEEEEEVEAKDEEKEEMGYATKEELAEVKEMIEEIKAILEPKEEMSEEPKEELSEEVEQVEVVAEEVVEEVVEQVKEELSQPAVEPLTHNPEANAKRKVEFKYAKNRKASTLDRVLNKLNN